ncbi:response regulator transcription factor [Chryseolinea sp. T2]|uniref:response regulator transcription factor n=1 Tax=Chryseolinea sp. T2 TaxID=3129255 RepID=UPI00307829FE
MEKIKVFVADDHKIVRVGLRGMLNLQADMTVVGEAEDGHGVLEAIDKQVIDVILMDIDMGTTNGIETTRQVKSRCPDISVIGITMHEEQQQIVAMLQAGASGYLLKNVGPEQLSAAVRAVADGNNYFSPEVSATLLQVFTKAQRPQQLSQTLTQRETEVLRLIAHEFSNQEIADKLFISVRTVDTHRRNILEKIQAKNTAGMVKYAIQHQLI